jgi:type I restriction enzyme, S subunit
MDFHRKKEEYLAQGSYPIIDQGKDYIAGFTNDGDGIYDKSPLIIFGDHTRILKYIDFPIFIGADGVKLLKNVFSEEEVLTKYIYYYLRTVNIPDTGYNRHFKFLKEVVIPIPSIDLQKRIVSVLDKAQELIDKRKAQIEALDQLTQSVFLEMFGDPITNNKEWPVISFSQVIKEIRYGTSTPPKFAEKGYMFVRATNIKNGKITKDNMLYISHGEAESIQKCKLNLGELIFVRSGVNSGDNAVVTEEFAGHYGGYDIIVQIDQNLVNPHYLNSLFNSSYLEVVIKPLTRRAGQPHLNADQIKGLKIPLPPIHLQQEFTVNLKKIEKQKELLQKSLMDLETNFNSLMQRAFKGELFND